MNKLYALCMLGALNTLNCSAATLSPLSPDSAPDSIALLVGLKTLLNLFPSVSPEPTAKENISSLFAWLFQQAPEDQATLRATLHPSLQSLATQIFTLPPEQQLIFLRLIEGAGITVQHLQKLTDPVGSDGRFIVPGQGQICRERVRAALLPPAKDLSIAISAGQGVLSALPSTPSYTALIATLDTLQNALSSLISQLSRVYYCCSERSGRPRPHTPKPPSTDRAATAPPKAGDAFALLAQHLASKLPTDTPPA